MKPRRLAASEPKAPRLPLAARLALRDARRHPWRSVLVVSLIAVAVLAAVAVVTLKVSLEPTRAELTRAELGQTLAARVERQYTPCPQIPLHPHVCRADALAPLLPPTSTPPPRAATTPLAEVLPDGYRLHTVRRPELRWAQRLPSGLLDLPVRTLDGAAWQAPLASIFPVDEGRIPSPGEVAITRSLAARLGTGVGAVLVLDGVNHRVVGVVRSHDRFGPMVVLPPGQAAPAAAAGEGEDVGGETMTWLEGPPLEWPDVQRLNAHGWAAYSRAVAAHPPAGTEGESRVSPATLVLPALMVCLGLGALVALCSTAFSIMAKDQRRMLGLLAATGAGPGFSTSLLGWTGLWLGGVGAQAGGMLGLPAGWVVAGWLDGIRAHTRHGLHVWWLPTLGIVAVGLASAMAASLLAARSLRNLDALAAVRTAVAPVTHARFPRGALLLLVGGLSVGGLPPLGLRASGFDPVHDAHGPWPEILIAGAVAGTCLVVAAVLMALPWLLQGLGTHAPVALRLALRDAARNRGRSRSSIAAVLAVSLFVGAALVGWAMLRADDEARRAADLPADLVQVRGRTGHDVDVTHLRTVVSTVVPVGETVVYTGVAAWPEIPEQNRCPSDLDARQRRADWRCDPTTLRGVGTVRSGDQDGLALFLGRPATATELAAWRAGTALATSPALVHDGHCLLRPARPRDDTSTTPPAPTSIPCLVAEQPVVPTIGVLHLPASLVGQGRLQTAPGIVVLRFARDLTWEESRDVEAALTADDAAVSVSRASLESPTMRAAGWIVAGVGMALVFLVASLTTALAVADARADESTLAAIGAAPGLRKGMAAGQMLVIAGIGSVVGSGLGVAAVATVLAPLAQTGPAVPWAQVAVAAVGTPLAGALVAWLVTPARLSMVRRLE